MRPTRARFLPFLLLPGLLWAGAAAGQTRVSTVLGFSSANLVGEAAEAEGYESRGGVYLGVWVEIPLFGPIAFAPGGHYVAKGFVIGQERFELSWFEVAAPLKLTVPVAGRVGAHLIAGPTFALGFGCTFKRREGNVETIFACQNSDFGLRSIDVTALLGGGVSVEIAPFITAVANVFLDEGLIDLREIDQLRSRAWMFNAGVTFPVGPPG